MESKSFIESLSPKTAFVTGCVTTVLVLGTVGFIVLGSCLLTGKCSIPGSAAIAAAPLAVANDPSAAAPAAGPVPSVTAADHVRGDKNAPVTIIEYSDFQCPFCSRFHPVMQQVMTNYAGKVKWVYRHFPLTSIHPEGEPSAIASECAGEQGKFWEFADKLVENQDSLSSAYYGQLAKTLGLNSAKFETCRTSDRAKAVVQAQQQGGAAAGVDGTPGSFVIGKDGQVQPIRGALPYDSVKAMVDAALQ